MSEVLLVLFCQNYSVLSRFFGNDLNIEQLTNPIHKTIELFYFDTA